MRIVIAAVAAALLSVALLQDSGRSRGAVQAARASANVAVIPGFKPAPYPGTTGVPRLPVTDASLSSYHFTEVPAAQVTAAELQQFDTVLLYGIRWSDLSATAHDAINAFARTGKVVIWDSDDTGAQNYSTFFRPFAVEASGEVGKPNDSVVSFPGGNNFLASPNPSSPYYLDPNQLVSDRNIINDVSVMKSGTSGWTPALIAANKSIPDGGWAIAWTYGVIADHTGMGIYSGIDADAFAAVRTPNYAIKALALQLAAPFLRSPDTSCAPGCHQPPPPTASGTKVYAACSFAKRVPRGWVRGRVPVWLQTSIASGITGQITTRSGKTLVSGSENEKGVIRLRIKTTRLPSNRSARLRAVVLVNGQQACSKPFRLKVDNRRPRLLLLSPSRGGGLALRVSEKAWMTMYGRGVSARWRHPTILTAHRMHHLRLSPGARVARMILRDRAGNKLVQVVRWP